MDKRIVVFRRICPMPNKIFLPLFFSSLLCISVQPFAQDEFPTPIMMAEKTSEGSAVVVPDEGIAGQYGTWTVTYTVGKSGIQTGGGIRVQLPDSFNAGPRNSANPLQATDPAGEHYVRAVCSCPDVILKTTAEAQTDGLLVKHSKVSLDGRYARNVFVVRTVLEKGMLQEGDTISVIYGDRSGGGAGLPAGTISSSPKPILIAVDSTGKSRFRELENLPTISCRPGSAVYILFHLPSQAVVGQPIRGLVSLMDSQFNPVEHVSRIDLSPGTGEADFPKQVTIPPKTGYVEFEIVPRAAGVLRINARTAREELLTTSNPARVTIEPPRENIYWGDIHSHTHYSWDGVGDDQFNFARYTTGLDFYAMTDHSMTPTEQGYTRGLSDYCWPEYTALNEKFNVPGRFVTIQAYECSLGTPYGHHNVYFRDKPGALMDSRDSTLPSLWEALEAGNALTIPHHTGKMPKDITFVDNNAEFRRNIEIYSSHGLSEVYNPKHPLAFENSLFTGDSQSVKTPSYVQNAWMMGLMFSTIASSDDHRAHPGLPHHGLAAVRASQLTRNDVFQGLYDRHTYGTTGAKIILDFTLNGAEMGETVELQGPPVLKVGVIGTDLIDSVEILSYYPIQGAPFFNVIHTWRPDGMEFEGEYTDPHGKPGWIYYVRATQKYKILDRLVMAWSSPIWTKPPGK